MTMADFLALPGFYQVLFLYIEPVSTMSPAIMAWVYPGVDWFHRELVPSVASPLADSSLQPRTYMAIWQLCNCYMLLGLISSLVFRAIRDALPHDPVSQERIMGACFTALALADVTHVVATLICLPESLKYSPGQWNPMTHGNISFVVVLFLLRMAWFFGIGRTRYYYGQRSKSDQAKR